VEVNRLPQSHSISNNDIYCIGDVCLLLISRMMYGRNERMVHRGYDVSVAAPSHSSLLMDVHLGHIVPNLTHL
jgi:hypothetical protein